MDRRLLALALLVFVLAFSLRFYDLAYPDFKWLDEGGHVTASTSYWNAGQFGPDNWEHPPLRHLILHGFLQVFGDNPYGWRMRNVLFGALAAALTCVFAAQVSGSRRAGLLAGLLLATDPLHVVLSRYTWEEIYGGAFFMAAIVCCVAYTRSQRWLVAAAAMMGCALATKWYYVPGWGILYLLLMRAAAPVPRRALLVTCVWILVPASVYLLSYYPWFGRGYTLGDFASFVVNAYHSLQSYQQQGYNPRLIFLSHIAAWEWFVRPVAVGEGTFISADTVQFILYANSLPVWILTLPSVVAMTLLSVKERRASLALPVLLFCGTYALCLFVRRPVFIYSAAPLLPFAFTAIAFCVSRVAERYGRRLLYLSVALMLGWNLYLYPLVTAKTVPVSWYRYLLERADVRVH